MSPTLSAWVSPAGPSSSCRTNGARELAAPEPIELVLLLPSLGPPSFYFFTADDRAFGKRISPPRDARVRAGGNGGAALRAPPSPGESFEFFLPARGGPPSWSSSCSSSWRPSSWPTTRTGAASSRPSSRPSFLWPTPSSNTSSGDPSIVCVMLRRHFFCRPLTRALPPTRVRVGREAAHLLAVRDGHGLEGGGECPARRLCPSECSFPFSFVSRRPIFFWPTADCVLRRPSWSSKDIILPPRADACRAWRPSSGRPWTSFGPSSSASGARRPIFLMPTAMGGRRVIRPRRPPTMASASSPFLLLPFPTPVRAGRGGHFLVVRG